MILVENLSLQHVGFHVFMSQLRKMLGFTLMMVGDS